jgi:uncharacterized membrane protein YphA (DoxX/SURF4 family)
MYLAMTTTHTPLATGSPDSSASHGLKCNFGIYVFAGGAIFLGIVGLASGQFANPYQHFPWTMPHRELLAYIFAAIELAAGLALLWPKRARIGALVLTLIYTLCALSWVHVWVSSFAHHRFGEPALFGQLFEQVSLALAALVLLGLMSGTDSFFARHERLIGHLYGLCPLAYGWAHIDMFNDVLVDWTPKWIPPSEMFWIWVTTISFFLAGAAILTGVLAPLASRLLAVELICFELLVWIPRLVSGPHSGDTAHDNWIGNAVCIALIGAAWVLADSISRTARRRRLRS